MQIIRTEDDETGQVVYEIDNYPVKVVTEPNLAGDGTTFVEVWDEAGCQDREALPGDQAEKVAIKTLLTEFRADTAEVAPPVLTVVQ